ncbi:phage tail protein [Limimaricola cinnabarinus]|uniref:phage tail protein n=1 Tax=Limimaricola cinnabarinus TaxID=1125964 RepID=UPI00249273F8|nr:phage tail protein [Limimaricola cinnabarinus]
MGIEAAIAGALAGTIGAGAATAVAGFVVNVGASLLLSTAANALMGGQPSAQDTARKLSMPDTAPAYRYLYGETRATGTPVGTPVRDEWIYGCWLLNSRPSDLTTAKLFLDKREVLFEGDPFDFSGSGATGTEFPFSPTSTGSEPHMLFWIGRGDQTSPPQRILNDAPWAAGADEDLWKPSDAWKGRTVIWMMLRAGGSGTRQERWPSTPPLVEVEGRWSRVWDMRDPAQDANDPATWQWSDNHALCCLDALRQNPIRRYTDATLHLSSWRDAADVADEVVTLASGATEKRYRVAGTLTFADGEVEDQINPLVLSGGADLIRIGGQLGIKPGAWQAPTLTLDYLMGDGFTAPDMVPGSDLVNELRVSYLNPDRGYETAELEPWAIPGALEADGGLPAPRSIELSFCPSPYQAMRVRKITGLRLRRQERIEGGSLPPEAFNLVAGANANVTLPAPYDALDGIYEVEMIHPAMNPLGAGQALGLVMPAALVKTGPEIYAWTPAEEEEVVSEPYDGERKGMRVPGALSVVTGDAVNLNTGKTTIPRIRFAFDPSPSSGVTGYEWEYRPTGDFWREGGVIEADVRDGGGKVFAFTGPLATGEAYDIRIRTVGVGGKSDWVEITGVSPTVSIDLDLPTFDRAEEYEPGKVRVWFEIPNDEDAVGLEIFAGPTTDPADAASMRGIIYGSPGATRRAAETVGSSTTRYYFARTRGNYAAASGFTAPVSFTTT